MKQQVAVNAFVQASVTVKKTDMLLQLFTLKEGRFQGMKHFFFFFCEFIGVFRINGREVGVPQFISHAFYVDGPLSIINFIQQHPVFQFIFRMGHDSLSLYLELADSDGLIHLRRQFRINRIVFIFIKDFRLKVLTRVIPINRRSKDCQRPQVNPVSDFQHIKIIVADVHPQYVCNAGPVSCRRAHPNDIVVSPLKIHVMVIEKKVHNGVRMRASVPDVSDDMQSVYRQVADQICHLDDEFFRHTARYNRIDDLTIVVGFIGLIIRMQQLIHTIREIFRKPFANL